MRLEFFVRGKRLTCRSREPLVGDTTGHYTFTVEFDREWQGLTKIVVFRNGKTAVQVRYTGETPIPAEVLGAGSLEVACHGYRMEEGRPSVVLRTIRMTRPLQLLESAPQAGDPPGPYTPTLFEEIFGAGTQAREAAAAARGIYELLEQKLHRGDFRGEQGLRGEPGHPGRDGSPGRDGKDGRTPGRGTDYWTAEDRQSILDDVMNRLPIWTGGAY